ncbi:iron chelate uptake ABC transporter family permease subunit [Micromonospora tulbaghiae]|uniref:FecCD family ABC transporter permease n=1 Tax=Micromonospora tulbaghiae TaxID=479978 RepID=UPI0033C355EB
MKAPPALRVGPVSLPVPARAVTATLAGVALLVVLVAANLGTGKVDIGLWPALRALVMAEDPNALLVREFRLPQTTVAVLVGATLGLSGALTQTFASNPLASPDILGVTRGASLAAVVVIAGATPGGFGADLAEGALQGVGLMPAALAGGLASAGLLWLLAWQHGLDPRRLVLVGIAVSTALTALTKWLLAIASIDDAASAQAWLVGTLNGRGWDHAIPVAAVLVVVFPPALLLIRHLNTIQLGDDAARGLGVRLRRTQALTLLAAVLLAAAAVSAVGPLDFVAFAVPQIALRLTGGSRPPMVASMVGGACLVVAADLVCRTVLPAGVPAGVVTAAVGAPYLIWLLIRANRRNSA